MPKAISAGRKRSGSARTEYAAKKSKKKQKQQESESSESGPVRREQTSVNSSSRQGRSGKTTTKRPKCQTKSALFKSKSSQQTKRFPDQGSQTDRQKKCASSPAKRSVELRKIPASVVSKWKPLTRSTRDFCVQSLDSSINMLLSRSADHLYVDIQDQLIMVRNRLLSKLNSCKAPENKSKGYRSLNSLVQNLSEAGGKLRAQEELLEEAVEHEESICKERKKEKDKLLSLPRDLSELHVLLHESCQEELSVSPVSTR